MDGGTAEPRAVVPQLAQAGGYLLARQLEQVGDEEEE
jgi:hypothetical protein